MTASRGRQNADWAGFDWPGQACSRMVRARSTLIGCGMLQEVVLCFRRTFCLLANLLQACSNHRPHISGTLARLARSLGASPRTPCRDAPPARMRAWGDWPNDLSSTNTITPLEAKFRDFCSRKCSDPAFSLPLLHITHGPPHGTSELKGVQLPIHLTLPGHPLHI
jgi:hypothetical protein